MSFPSSVRAVLDAKALDKKLCAELRGLGVAPTVLNAIHWAMSSKAAKGDPSAAKYLRDTLEEGADEPEKKTKKAAPDLSALTDEELWAMAERGEG